jgi:putative hemolysin
MSRQVELTRSPGDRQSGDSKLRGATLPRRGIDWLRLVRLASPGIARLYRLRDQARAFADPFDVARATLAGLEVNLALSAADEARIPASGPLIITANHPFGGLDGIAAIDTIGRRRRDLRLLANPGLAAVEALAALVIPVDPFGGAAATRANGKGMREALRWVRSGGVLLIFPAGEVSNLDLRARRITDRAWNPTAARLIRLAGAAVTPMYFHGANSALFQLAGIVHPRLRTLLLPRELSNKVGARVVVRIGESLPAAKLAACKDDTELAAQLRLRTYLLAAPEATATEPCAAPRRLVPLTAPVEPRVLAREIDSLPPAALLVSSKELRVYCAAAAQLPATLRELGRLREDTFRAVGEGTGRAADIDAFDDYYEHLFIWNAAAREIVGAYRLGRTDLISQRCGKRGLYTATLFEYHDLFFKLLGPALELGRSFVRAEYQKSFAPLRLLWRGIGEYVGRHPEYCKLLGPVSISNDYCRLSQALVVQFLRRRNFERLAPTLVRARQPFRRPLSLRTLGGAAQPHDLDGLSALVAGVEPDGKGTPVLLRQYLKLGGRVLGFNIDPDFGHSIDCLLLVDLRRTDPRVLQKYMSQDAWEAFSAAHPQRRGRRRRQRASETARIRRPGATRP